MDKYLLKSILRYFQELLKRDLEGRNLLRRPVSYIVITAISITGGYLIYDKYSKGKRTSEVIETDYTLARLNMVEYQIRARDITDEKVLKAMEKVPQHEFVVGKYKSSAYGDSPLPIDYDQTISQPYIVALMTQCLELKGEEKVLEIGTGSGYQSAVLNEIVKEVYSIEIIDELAGRVRKTLKRLGYKVKVKMRTVIMGGQEHVPFDAIMITAAVNYILPPLFEQLKDGGKMLMPLGSPFCNCSIFGG